MKRINYCYLYILSYDINFVLKAYINNIIPNRNIIDKSLDILFKFNRSTGDPVNVTIVKQTSKKWDKS